MGVGSREENERPPFHHRAWQRGGALLLGKVRFDGAECVRQVGATRCGRPYLPMALASSTRCVATKKPVERGKMAHKRSVLRGGDEGEVAR